MSTKVECNRPTEDTTTNNYPYHQSPYHQHHHHSSSSSNHHHGRDTRQSVKQLSPASPSTPPPLTSPHHLASSTVSLTTLTLPGSSSSSSDKYKQSTTASTFFSLGELRPSDSTNSINDLMSPDPRKSARQAAAAAAAVATATSSSGLTVSIAAVPAQPPRILHENSPESEKKVDYDVDYFNRMSRRIQDGFKDDIDKEVFAENIMKQIHGKELYLSGHKYPSTCIQWVIENSSDLGLIKSLAQAFYPKGLDPVELNNQHTARIIQLLLEAALKILSNEYSSGGHCPEEPSRHGKWTEQYISAFGQFMIIHMNTILTEGSGAHVMVTVVEALGGIRIGRHWSRKTMGFAMRSNINTELEKDNVIKEIPAGFRNLLKKFAKHLIVLRSDRDLKDIILGRGTSLIQNLLFILKVRISEVCQVVVKRLVDIIFANAENKFAITTNSVSAYLVEAIMLVCTQHRLSRIWDKYLKGNLMDMWKDDIANFVVQRLIDAVQDINLFKAVCDEMLPELGNVFAYNRPGIGVCLAKACSRFPSMQDAFIAALMKAFNCFEPKDRQIYLVPLMLFGDNLPGTKYRRVLWLHGSLMLQYIFRYEDPYKVSKSLLSLDPRRLVDVCTDKSGSHVIDCFLQSPHVMEKHKNQFKEKMRGFYIHVACDRFGSKVIDFLLDNSDDKMKSIILEELTAHEVHCNGSGNGGGNLTGSNGGGNGNHKNGHHQLNRRTSSSSSSATPFVSKHRHFDWKSNEIARNNRDKRRRPYKEFSDDEDDNFYSTKKQFIRFKRY